MQDRYDLGIAGDDPSVEIGIRINGIALAQRAIKRVGIGEYLRIEQPAEAQRQIGCIGGRGRPKVLRVHFSLPPFLRPARGPPLLPRSLCSPSSSPAARSS